MKITPYQIGGIFNVFNILLALIILISAIVYTRESETIAYFATVSIISGIIIIFLGFGALARWVADRTRMDEMPIYHSPWIFPIYKYYPKDNDIEAYSSAVVAFYTIVGLAWLWCVMVTVEISPSYVGVALTCVLEGITVFVTLYFINTNNVQYKKIRAHVDQLCIKTAWLDAKENLVKMVQIESRSEYVSYETWWRRRHELRNYMNFWRGNTVLAWPEQDEFVVQ